MTEPDRDWFRDAVDPILGAHEPRDRWRDLRRQVEERPRLVVPVGPRRRSRPGGGAWLAAALLVAALLGAAVVAIGGGDDGEGRAGPDPSSTVSTTDAPSSTGATPPSTAGATLVEVPVVSRRVDLAPYGLQVRYLDLADAAVPEGAVVSQYPAPGVRVPEGEVVVVVMSGGGPVTRFDDLPPEARAFAEGLPDYQRAEPIRRVLTAAGEAFKTDAWLYGPCRTMPEARRALLDPSYAEDCY